MQLNSYLEWEKKSRVTILKMLTNTKNIKKFRTVMFLLIDWHTLIILKQLRLNYLPFANFMKTYDYVNTLYAPPHPGLGRCLYKWGALKLKFH